MVQLSLLSLLVPVFTDMVFPYEGEFGKNGCHLKIWLTENRSDLDTDTVSTGTVGVHIKMAAVGKKAEDTSLVFIPTAANAEKGDKGWLINDLINLQKLNLKNVKIVPLETDSFLISVLIGTAGAGA